MPTKLVTPEEWYHLTGERGSVYIESNPRTRVTEPPSVRRREQLLDEKAEAYRRLAAEGERMRQRRGRGHD